MGGAAPLPDRHGRAHEREPHLRARLGEPDALPTRKLGRLPWNRVRTVHQADDPVDVHQSRVADLEFHPATAPLGANAPISRTGPPNVSSRPVDPVAA